MNGKQRFLGVVVAVCAAWGVGCDLGAGDLPQQSQAQQQIPFCNQRTAAPVEDFGVDPLTRQEDERYAHEGVVDAVTQASTGGTTPAPPPQQQPPQGTPQGGQQNQQYGQLSDGRVCRYF